MTKNRKLSDHNRELLLIHLHRVIEDTAQEIAHKLIDRFCPEEMTYPPNCGLTQDEMTALSFLKGIQNVESALRKVIADAACRPIYQLLCIIDGIDDPEGKDWSEVALLDREEDDVEGEFLNTTFYDKYWEWREIRPQKEWKLDVL